MESIFAGIVLYNPNLDVLKKNIEAIKNQVQRVILVDNHSDNCLEIQSLIKNYDCCFYLVLDHNYGIAKALNSICEYANQNGAKWVLTLDQDSECLKNLIDMYLPYTSQHDIGQITSLYMDRNFPDELSGNKYNGVEEIEWCITSAALVNISAWKDVSGFDDNLFIDVVDLDICLSMREKGYKILEVGQIGFIHEIGQGKEIEFWRVRIKTWNHSPIRRYYNVRNNIIVAKKHNISLIRTMLGVIKHIFIIFIFEGDKKSKLISSWKGIVAGLRYKVN